MTKTRLGDVTLIATPVKIRFCVVFTEFFRSKRAILERDIPRLDVGSAAITVIGFGALDDSYGLEAVCHVVLS